MMSLPLQQGWQPASEASNPSVTHRLMLDGLCSTVIPTVMKAIKKAYAQNHPKRPFLALDFSHHR
jgi:hypothetical protein